MSQQRLEQEQSRVAHEPTAEEPTGLGGLRQNLGDLPRALTLTAWLAGLVSVLIAYTGPLVLVFQAAENAGLSPEQLSSWIWALTVGSGLTALALSLWYRQPLTVAWSIAGSALLVGELERYALPEAIGAYLVAGLAVVALGYSGLFGRLLALVPEPVVMGMLAGVLLQFGVALFTALPQSPLMVLVMIAVFLLLQRSGMRAPSIGAFLAGLAVAASSGELHLQGVTPELAQPQWIWPAFSLRSLLGLSLPLFILAIASQNAPGIAVLRSAGYRPPVDGPVLVTGIASVLTAPFGGHGLNLAALMGAICSSPEAHPQRELRYGAGVAAALGFIVLGSFGATAVALFDAFPPALIAAVAGLALTPALHSSLSGAMADTGEREGALFALLFTAANVSLLGIGAPFWGLIAGVLVSRVLRRH